MNRRIWIKQITLAGGGMLILPACLNDKGGVSVALKSISITAKEEKLLAEITEAIIPETKTPGAKSLNLHQFLLKMVDDCYDKQQQEKYLSGLRQLNSYSKENAEQPFNELKQDEKLSLFRNIRDGKSQKEHLQYFLSETRRWVMKGYDTSEYFMTKIIPYELVPGRFHGCVKILQAL